MRELTLHIERLEPLRVAAVTVTSRSPEGEAINALCDWVRPKRLLNGEFRFFGYDNCQPYPNHTYTTWLTVGADVQPSGGVEIVDFPGGQFAVTEIQGVEQISPAWRQLERLCRERSYRFGGQPGLEEHLDLLGDVPLSEQRFRLLLSISE